nr:MAG TPA: hypothetical protein [Caudoviricetes sp.]
MANLEILKYPPALVILNRTHSLPYLFFCKKELLSVFKNVKNGGFFQSMSICQSVFATLLVMTETLFLIYVYGR